MFPIPLKQLNDQQRHDYVLKNFILNKSNNTQLNRYKRDIDVIKDNHRFLWQEEETEEPNEASWEERLARRYYDKLFKEYCIADLTYYKQNKVALRWRIESEVVSGKGQFQCGSRKCEAREDLRTWEVNFGYMEQGSKKNALVKLRLCAEHSMQLNYTSQKREVKRLTKQAIKERKRDKHKKHDKKQKIIENIDKQIEKQEKEVKEEEALIENETKAVEMPVDLPDTSENIWSKKVEIENEQETREQEFERYLEDLLF